ncbi:MAG: hypothetical protein ACOYMD_00315 [Paludibacter sp.]
MTQNEFIDLVKKPENVNANHVADLKWIVEQYPYFSASQILYSKSLQMADSIHFESHLKKMSIYNQNRRWFYYYIHPEKKLSNEPYRRIKNEKSAGDYFDMMQIVESSGGDSKQSLKNLAEKLKSAREMVVNLPGKPIKRQIQNTENPDIPILTTDLKPVSDDYFSMIDNDISEDNAKKLIAEKKYADAIVILRQLNFSNPKKSVYFADQIRFLEKVIEISKK